MGIGLRWSLSSRLGKGIKMEFLGEDKEDLIRYARTILEKDNIDYFIFGHRHLEMKYSLNNGVEIIFLGDWIMNGSYAVWDGINLDFLSILLKFLVRNLNCHNIIGIEFIYLFKLVIQFASRFSGHINQTHIPGAVGYRLSVLIRILQKTPLILSCHTC